MKLVLVGVFFALSGFAAESDPQLKCPIPVVPGRSIGPIHLGQGLKEIQKFGVPVHAIEGSSSVFRMGSIEFTMDEQGKVQTIETELGSGPDCLIDGSKKLGKHLTEKQLLAHFRGRDGIAIVTHGRGGLQKNPVLQVKASK